MINTDIKALLIEDEEHIVNFLRLRLETEKYSVVSAATMRDGLSKAQTERPDLVILDLGLPDGDGMEFIRKVRSRTELPIIVLSARSGEMDKVSALDAGADDYVTKPFGIEELLARMRTVLRTRKVSSEESVKSDSFGDLTIEYETRRVAVAGRDVRLTKTEYRILSYLAKNSGRLLTYEEIINHIWEWMDAESVKKLQVNMANIRRKLGEVPGEKSWIYNELGVGYRMR